MKPKIEINSLFTATEFGDLEPGDTFIYNELLYQRIDHLGEPAAVVLGDGMSQILQPATKVMLINITITGRYV